MIKAIRFSVFLPLALMLSSLVLRAQPMCDLTNYSTIPLIGPAAFPYTSPTSGITVSATLTPGFLTIGNANYTCGGNTFATSATAWWIGSSSPSIDTLTLNFSCPVTNFTVVMNGTNAGEQFYFNSATGTNTLSNFCTANFSAVGNTLICNPGSPSTGTIVTITNSTGSTQFKLTHNGAAAGSRITLLDCFTCNGIGVQAASNGPVCEGGTLNLTASAVANGTYSWVGPNGFTSAQQNPTLAPVTPAMAGSYSVMVTAPGTNGVDTAKGTVDVVVVTGAVDAGLADTISGCASYRDTLQGSISNTTAGITYNIAWTPTASIVSGGNTLTPIIAPTGTTLYTMTVSTPSAQGGCVYTDTVRRWVRDVSVDAGFSYNIRYGCDQDTVEFTNLSTQSSPGFSALNYLWTFGDGTQDTATNPVHIYASQGLYTVKLITQNVRCTDSLSQQVDLEHPLEASFTQSADSFCQGGTVNFTNTSVTTIRNAIAPKYFWTFGDGGTDTVANPTYTFTRAGVWPVTLTVTDFVPCTSIYRDTVVIDSIPFVRINLSDSSLCLGQAVTFTGDYLPDNNTGLSWSFGDGTGLANANPATHGYDQGGNYTITLTASYRICPDTTTTREITIRPFTPINLGPDTTICPGGEPIRLTARLGTTPADGAKVRWSTGDTASAILVRHHGVYWATADREGCLSSDSVIVKKDCYLDLPNSFTPNGDGINDYFWPRQDLSSGIVRFTMRIYNRWGQPVWETSMLDGRGWDGTFNGADQPAGVYVYLIEAELANGYREKYQGNVTLLR